MQGLTEVQNKIMRTAAGLTDDESVRVTKRAHSCSVHCCYGDPVLLPCFHSGDVQAVLSAAHSPVLVLLLTSLHTPHLHIKKTTLNKKIN